jgi:uncharacterized damage-inducible protein DinB
MRLLARVLCSSAIVAVISVPVLAQTPTTSTSLMGDLIKDVTDVESKMNQLAKALPAGAYDWRPGKGARSTSEVFAHIAADNYFLPAALGVAAPVETGINGKDYKTAAAFEKKPMTREQVTAELQKSFAFLKKAMAGVPDAKLTESIEVFGQKTTARYMWVTTVTHLHEHLGQLIAYARGNNVTPPWSK